MQTSAPNTILDASEWGGRAAAHRERAGRHTQPARARRDRRLPHPIDDFLFEYYSYPFSSLENWHPGIGVALEWPGPGRIPPPFTKHQYVSSGGLIFADPAGLSEKERVRLERVAGLLEATRDRAPNLACHGLHEWAMVYQGVAVRHEASLRLRLPQAEIDALVESRPIRCSHHDAFRFFAPAARPFNLLQPCLETRELMEQPACLHANMDLYKWAAKTVPWTGSDLLLDCFELAVELRDLDMRASPYDLTPWNRPPVAIETPDGRRQYETEQRRLARRAKPLRQRLIDKLRETLAAA